MLWCSYFRSFIKSTNFLRMGNFVEKFNFLSTSMGMGYTNSYFMSFIKLINFSRCGNFVKKLNFDSTPQKIKIPLGNSLRDPLPPKPTHPLLPTTTTLVGGVLVRGGWMCENINTKAFFPCQEGSNLILRTGRETKYFIWVYFMLKLYVFVWKDNLNIDCK